MRLLKITSFAVLALLFTHTANGQVYVNVGIGYGAPALRDLIAVDYEATQSSETYTGVYSSLGMGFQPDLTLGYKFNENVGLELGYGFLLGSKIVSEVNDASSPNVETGEQRIHARMHRLMLGTKVTAADGDFHPYIRVGFALGVGGKVISEMETTTTGPSFSGAYHSLEEYSGGMAFGFNGGIGFTYHVSDAFGIFVEAAMIAQNYAPAHSELTTLDIDGQDQLGSMTIRQKQTDYVTEYTNPSGPPNDGAPDEDLRFYLPMSSIGIGAGVHFYFGQ